MFDISAYLPDALIPAYNNFRETVVTALWILGIGNGVAHDVSAGNSHISQPNTHPHCTTESNSARKALSDAEHSLRLARDEAQEAAQDSLDLFDPEGFGVEGEWKKLDGLCISKDTGEYVLRVKSASMHTHDAQVHLRSLPLR